MYNVGKPNPSTVCCLSRVVCLCCTRFDYFQLRRGRMSIKDLNWRLIVFSALGAAVGINLLSVLLTLLLFKSRILKVITVNELEFYFAVFALFSPLIASLISSGIVTFFSRQKKLLNIVFSTIITFIAAAWLLAALTKTFILPTYDDFDKQTNPCYYSNCGE
jgi:hypothetical protein